MSSEGQTSGRRAPLLHGILEVTIKDATLPFLFSKREPIYVTISLGRTIMAKTTEEKNPTWNQTFKILCAHPPETDIVLKVRRKNYVIACTSIPANRLIAASDHSYDSSSFPAAWWRCGQLKFLLRLLPAAEEQLLGWGLGLGEGVTFLERENCDLVFYQDAHHRKTFAPPVYDGDGRKVRPRKLWEDIYSAINGAKHLIYIAGWAFNHKIVLVRDPDTDIPEALGVELGELLKRKASEGVAVRVMLWDDATSLPLIKNPGLMETQDEDAFSFFYHTPVICQRFARLYPSRIPTPFAHHQKTISVDSLSSNGQEREIVSFLGGLDLFNGRYDTEEHSLFGKVDGGEFYQVSISGAGARHGGPREPWHDVHCKIRGAAAVDVLANFEHRWRKQSDLKLHDSILPLLLPSSGDWNAQIFRSIDDLSSTHLPETRSAERSIHEAYVAAIRRAKRFIYIENQYFLGGCNLWEKDRRSGCENLVPAEIALKIAAKIRAGERFVAYVVVPMWPEGAPETATVQEILHWQRRTMEMMYRLVGEAMREKGIGGNPREYLSFFCLGKKEMPVMGEKSPSSPPKPPGHYYEAQTNRRFMIYLHAKLMIVDDEYLLMGSANVNQRSMDGERDTEIAVGCYQPIHRNNGGVRDFRMSLWHEHTGGGTSEVFSQPERADCVRELNDIADKAWQTYSGGAAVDTGGVHLIRYPLEVDHEGRLKDGGVFPDTKTLVRGKRHWWFPPILTT